MPSMYNNDQDYYKRIEQIMFTRTEADIRDNVISAVKDNPDFAEDVMLYMMHNHMNKKDLASMFAGFELMFKDEV